MWPKPANKVPFKILHQHTKVYSNNEAIVEIF